MVAAFQTALRLIYPPRCLTCEAHVEEDFGLCGSCWRDTPFITGLACDLCGVPLPGEAEDAPVICDDCLQVARPWSKGRAALVYRDLGRRLVLSLKHGDRLDIARTAAQWMAKAAEGMMTRDMPIVPIPLHWTRMLKRRFNQSAVLAQALARETGLEYCPDFLLRHTRTPSLNGFGFDARFRAIDGSMIPNPRQVHLGQDRPILLIDDVMTAGATLSTATQAAFAAGARDVCVLVLARVTKDA